VSRLLAEETVAVILSEGVVAVADCVAQESGAAVRPGVATTAAVSEFAAETQVPIIAEALLDGIKVHPFEYWHSQGLAV